MCSQNNFHAIRLQGDKSSQADWLLPYSAPASGACCVLTPASAEMLPVRLSASYNPTLLPESWSKEGIHVPVSLTFFLLAFTKSWSGGHWACFCDFFPQVVVDIFIVGYSGFHSGRKKWDKTLFQSEKHKQGKHQQQFAFLKNLWILKLVCTRTKCNRTSFWETRLTPPWPILYMSESILCFYWRTSKCSCAPHNTLYSLQSPRCPKCPPHCPAAPRRCGAGCWICALLDVCLHYCHTERYMAIFQWSRLKIVNPSAAQKYCQNKQF